MSVRSTRVAMYAGPVLIAALVGLVYARGLQEDARQLAETGREHQRLLARLNRGIGQLDAGLIASCYHPEYGDEPARPWLPALRSNRDGIRVYDLRVSESPLPGAAGTTGQLAGFIEPITNVESSKVKLGAIEEIGEVGQAVVRAYVRVRGTNDAEEAFESQIMLRLWTRKVAEEWSIRRQELVYGTTTIGDGILLYRNTGGLTFTDVTAAAGLPTAPIGATVGLFADLDNDGDQDLLLGSSTDHNRLFRNEGDGSFSEVSAGANLGRNFVAVAGAADYDGDGLLDLYLGRYLDPRRNLPTTLFYTRNSEGNSLLRNVGGLRFEDVTEAAGVRDGGLTLGMAWGDYDVDGHQDLYVANDFGRNGLYRNNGDGTFAEVAQASGALDFGFGMSASFGDVDNDGDLDLYVSNVHSGQRWYGQASILYQYLITSVIEGTIFEDFSEYMDILALSGSRWNSFGDQMVKGNSLLINDGSGGFSDVSVETRTNPFGWYWSSALLDFDNDGLQDIYAVNGWISAASKDDL